MVRAVCSGSSGWIAEGTSGARNSKMRVVAAMGDSKGRYRLIIDLGDDQTLGRYGLCPCYTEMDIACSVTEHNCYGYLPGQVDGKPPPDSCPLEIIDENETF